MVDSLACVGANNETCYLILSWLGNFGHWCSKPTILWGTPKLTCITLFLACISLENHGTHTTCNTSLLAQEVVDQF